MRNEFIRTENATRFDELCQELESRESLIGPSLGMVVGPAGRGKSEAAKRVCVQTEAVYIPPMLIRTPLMLLKEVCFELAAIRPGRTDGCLAMIKSEMRKYRRLIIIDEADLLEMRNLEMLRNLNETTSAPILLIGEEDLVPKIESKRRLSSRIRRRMHFSAVTQADVALFYKRCLGLTLSPEQVQLLHKDCQGDWRPVLAVALAIERAMKASGLTELTTELADNVVNEMRRR